MKRVMFIQGRVSILFNPFNVFSFRPRSVDKIWKFFFFYQTLPLLLFDTLVNFRGCIDRWSMIKFADRTAKFYGTSKKMILFFDIWDVLRRSKIILYFSRQYRLVTARIAGILMKLSQDLVNLVSFIRIPETCDYNNSDLFLSIHFLRVESKTF